MRPNSFADKMENLRLQSLSEKNTHFQSQLETAKQLISQQLPNANVCCQNGKTLHEQHLNELATLDYSSQTAHDVVELQRRLDQDQNRLGASTRYHILHSCLTELDRQFRAISSGVSSDNEQKEDEHNAPIINLNQLVAYLTDQIRIAKSHCAMDENKTQLWLDLLLLKIKLMTAKDFHANPASQHPICHAFIQHLQQDQTLISDKLMRELDSENKKATTYGINRLINAYMNNNKVLHLFYHLGMIEAAVTSNNTVVQAEFSNTLVQTYWEKACDDLNLSTLKHHPVITRDLKHLNSKRIHFSLFLKSLSMNNDIIQQSLPHFTAVVQRQAQILNPMIQRFSKPKVNLNVDYDQLQDRIRRESHNHRTHLIDYVMLNKITGFLNNHTALATIDNSISLHTLLQDEFDRVLERANVAQFEDPAERNYAFKLLIKQFESYLTWFIYDAYEWKFIADQLQRYSFDRTVINELLSHLLQENTQRLKDYTSNYTYYSGANLNQCEDQLHQLFNQCQQHYPPFRSLSSFSLSALQTFASSKKMALILEAWFTKHADKLSKLQKKAQKKNKDPNLNADYVKKVRKHQYIESIIKQLNSICHDSIESIFSIAQTAEQVQSLKHRFNSLHQDFFSQSGLSILHGRRKSKIPEKIESALKTLLSLNKHQEPHSLAHFQQRPSLTPVGDVAGRFLNTDHSNFKSVSAHNLTPASHSSAHLDTDTKQASSSVSDPKPVSPPLPSSSIQNPEMSSSAPLSQPQRTPPSRRPSHSSEFKRAPTPPPSPAVLQSTQDLSLPPGMELSQPAIESKLSPSRPHSLSSIQEETQRTEPRAEFPQGSTQAGTLSPYSPTRRASATLPPPPVPPLPTQLPSAIPSGHSNKVRSQPDFLSAIANHGGVSKLKHNSNHESKHSASPAPNPNSAKARSQPNFLSAIVNHGGVLKLKHNSNHDSKPSASPAPQSLLQQIQNGRNLVKLKKVSSQASAPVESKARTGSLFDPNNRAFASATQHRKSGTDILKDRRRDINGNSDSDWDTDDSSISFDY